MKRTKILGIAAIIYGIAIIWYLLYSIQFYAAFFFMYIMSIPTLSTSTALELSALCIAFVQIALGYKLMHIRHIREPKVMVICIVLVITYNTIALAISQL